MKGRYAALLCLIANAGCITAAELLLKVGALETASGGISIFGISALGSAFTVGGIVCYIAGFGLWMYVLKSVPLSLAFSFTTIQQATVFVGAWYFLGEPLPPLRIAGICVLMVGVLLLVPAIIRAEEKTEGQTAVAPGYPVGEGDGAR